MSGTSADGIDAALVQFQQQQFALLAHHHQPFSAQERSRIHRLADASHWPATEFGETDITLGHAFADACRALLAKAGRAPADICAIGSHGQTIRHQPPGAGATPFTLQIGDPNTIAELTGIDTIADFRRRDMAAGGQGAPLAPGFHHWAWGKAQQSLAVVNLGGISNVTWIGTSGEAQGFDCGPANTLMDAWCQRHLDQAFDRNGDWAASGKPCKALLDTLTSHPFLQLTGPRSTGREAFNLDWLDRQLKGHPQIAAADVQATLCEFSALCIARSLHEKAASHLYCCGGGAYNQQLLRSLQAALPDWQVSNTAALGLPPEWVEATAFAWLAYQFNRGHTGNLPAVTGAQGQRRLGALYPGR